MNTPSGSLVGAALVAGLTGCGGGGGGSTPDTPHQDQYKDKDFSLVVREAKAEEITAMEKVGATKTTVAGKTHYVLTVKGAKTSITDEQGNVVPGITCDAAVEGTNEALTRVPGKACTFVADDVQGKVRVTVQSADHVNANSPKVKYIDVVPPSLVSVTLDNQLTENTIWNAYPLTGTVTLSEKIPAGKYDLTIQHSVMGTIVVKDAVIADGTNTVKIATQETLGHTVGVGGGDMNQLSFTVSDTAGNSSSIALLQAPISML